MRAEIARLNKEMEAKVPGLKPPADDETDAN
jgi:hypothetical protein